MTLKIHIPKIDILLKCGIMLLTIKVLLGNSAVVYYNDFVDTLLSISSSVLFALVIIRQKYSTKTLMIYALIVILGLINAYLTGELGFFITIMTCLAITGQKFDDIIKYIYFCQLSLFIIHCFIAAVSITISGDNLTTVIGGVTRYQFGFNHPNTLSVYIFELILLWAWIHYKTIMWSSITGIFVITGFVFLFTRTRTFLYESIILCILLAISKSNKKIITKILNLFARYAAIMCSSIILFLTMNYKSMNTVVLAINSILTGRIKLGAYAYEKLGVTLLGQSGLNSVQWDQFWQLNGYTYDCAYTYLTMEKGVIWLIIICVSFYMLSKKGTKKIDVFITVWAFYAITEVHPLNCYLSFPILLISQLSPTVKIRKIARERTRENIK